MVYVGKQKGFHTRTQDEIHELLCCFALEGSTVLRLKGGDPFVFGRGGEEVQYLEQRNIQTCVVPGINFSDNAGYLRMLSPCQHATSCMGKATAGIILHGHSQTRTHVKQHKLHLVFLVAMATCC